MQTIAELLKKRRLSYQLAKGRDISPGPGQILVTTFHQLKGLEFDHVVLTGMEDNTLPAWYLNLETSETPEEKMNFLRRLVYVAMTRARKSCVLAGATPFSRFFDEVPSRHFALR
jgi:superfamily I DNA/RNA helicase